MPSSRIQLHHIFWLLIGLTVLFVIVWQAPAFYTVHGLANYLPLHIFAETFSIVISMMVFGVAWNSYKAERPGSLMIFACGLLSVGLIDFVHMLSFKGMPDFITPSGPEKAINFWLSARLIMALVLLAVALRPWRQPLGSFARYGSLTGSLAITVVVIWLGLAYPDAWPHTFIEGEGLTTFKVGAEYAIIVLLLGSAVRFYVQAKRTRTLEAASLFAATVITILSELCFTIYSDVADIFNLLGHLYKIAAYAFIYRAVFVASVHEPYRRLDDELAENRRMTKQLQDSVSERSQLAAIVEFSNDAIFSKTLDGIIISWNKGAENIYGYAADEVIGKRVTMLAPPEQHAEILQLLAKISNGEVVQNHEAERICKDGSRIYVSLSLSPVRDNSGKIVSISTIARDITGQKLAALKLERSQAGLAEAQRIAHLGNWELNLTKDELTWSDEIYRIFEIERTEFGASYEAFLNAIHPEDREMVNKAYTDSVKNKQPYDIVHRLLMPDGRIKYVNEKCETYYDGEGKPAHSFGTVHDITDRIYNQQTLLRLNRELRAISNCNEVLMRAEDEQKLLDEICRIVCEDAGYRMAWVGYPENDAAKTIRPVAWAGVEDGYLAKAAITWADTERGRGSSGIAIRTGKSASFQDFSTDPAATPWRDAALQRGYRSSLSMPLKDEHGATFGILTIYSAEPRAFTPEETRLLEELAGDMAFGIRVLRVRFERQQAEAALAQSEYMYRTLVENVPVLIVRYDTELRRTYVNPAWEQASGLSAKEVVNIPADKIPKVPKPIVSEYESKLRKAIETGTLQTAEFNWVNARGETLYLDYLIVPELDRNGKVSSVLSVGHDITGRKRAEDEIRKLNQELEQRVAARTADLEAANKELESFSYSVSHDLRTPLRAIDGFSNILLEDYRDKLDDEGKRLLKVVRENTRKMGQLIDDILNFSRTGRVGLTASEIDMDRLVHAVFDELQATVIGNKPQLKAGSLPHVRGDSAMIRQVMVNLLSNAIKFSRTQSKPVIQVGASVADNETVISVKDNGVGFDMQYADKLFGIFQRLHSMEEFEGTGIGLAIVKRIITRHGGRVWADGKVNEGATFYFSLPHPVLKDAVQEDSGVQ